MRYIYLKTLSLIKKALMGLISACSSLYGRVADVLSSSKAKEKQRIQERRNRTIQDAKKQIVYAAQRVVELELQLPEVEKKATDKADDATFKVDLL